jgi:hypothetical protein
MKDGSPAMALYELFEERPGDDVVEPLFEPSDADEFDDAEEM